MKKTKTILCLITIGAILMLVAGTINAEEAKININTASVEELAKLDRVGPSIAQSIVDYRTKNGHFKDIKDIINVSGIGEKIFEMNKNRITVGSTSGSESGNPKDSTKKQ